MDDVLAMAQMVDAAELDLFGIGEHHTPEYTVSATATVMAAVAAVTKRIRITSASTLLSTADPVRTFEEFATVDLISGGRAELIVSRGAFIEGFTLFGFDINDYDPLFAAGLTGAGQQLARLRADGSIELLATKVAPAVCKAVAAH